MVISRDLKVASRVFVNYFYSYSLSACEQRINTTLGAPLQDHQYFASSVTPGNEAHFASLSNPGVWVPASSYASDRNQFLQIDFERLVRVTKVSMLVFIF